MKKICVYIIILLLIHNLTGCGEYASLDEQDSKLVFVYQDVNYSSGYSNDGYYIDSKGRKVKFDLSEADEKYSDIDNLVTYLQDNDLGEGREVISAEDMEMYYEWLCKMSSFCILEEKCVMVDSGSKSLYGVRYKEGKEKPEIVLIYEQGDWIRANTDKYAEKLSDVEVLIEKWPLEWFEEEEVSLDIF